jgi:hypothetical protein
MAENKTKATEMSVQSYLSNIKDESRRKDCEALSKLMSKVTKEQPRMWGTSIVGFGTYHYKYESGREGEAPLAGFSFSKPWRRSSLSRMRRDSVITRRQANPLIPA